MSTPAHAAADQLVRLTRLIIRADNPEFTPDSPRILRHNGAELSAQEHQVFRAMVRGDYDDRLADLLQLPIAAIGHHRAALRTDFHSFVPDVRAEPLAAPPVAEVRQAAPPLRRRSWWRRTAEMGAVGVVAGALAAGVGWLKAAEPAHVARRAATPRRVAVVDPLSSMALFGVAHVPRPPKLPSGIATATSFWDRATASRHRMTYKTIASPYWPLGTKVRISYRKGTAVGVVQDFGPAEWAVAQHDIPAIIDISEAMMADLTGSRKNAVHVKFHVLIWGHGPAYRAGGPGYALATGRH
jgi:hypothetical protein